MDIEKVITELHIMPRTIKMDALAWKQNVLQGGTQMQQYADVLAKIYGCEGVLHAAKTARTLRAAANRINKLYKRLDRYYNAMQHCLEVMHVINQRTEHMWQRVLLWNEDQRIKEHSIICDLTTPKLLEFLQFLSKRYEYEWEVKEMVLIGLKEEHWNSTYDMTILVESWLNNGHAGGEEFNEKLNAFLNTVGRSTVNWNLQ